MSGFVKKRNLLIIFGLVFSIIFFYFIIPVSVPLITAFITALFLEPIVRLFQTRLRLNRRFSVIIVFLLFLFFLGISGYFIITKVITEAIKVAENAPFYVNEVTKAWLRVEAKIVNAAQDLPDEVVNKISKRVQNFLNNLKNDLLAYININNIKTLLTNIPNFFISFLVYLIALFLFLIDLPRLREGISNHLNEKTADKVHFMTSRLSYVVFGFLKAQFLVSVLIFIITLLGLSIISPKIALVMSLVIWLIDFIPIIGSISVLGPWALFHFLTGDFAIGIKLAVLAGILLIIRRIIEPKVMGSQIGLSSLATLISMYLGLKLLGVLGMIIGPFLLIAFNSAREAGIIKLNFKI
ncbi:sporulation integral membrane protein YtvI [Bacillus methanolicus]|uniref:sporulation integral membrane protein YtvI n=1 Tax=Bacillus methanolicus TaxID=1471 RepID=UPI00200C31D0|nr:sporulation integral membrane protein YtvI [Bacillus methanolicus]UQD51584.1 sporulation integral membrane protein YtvI [Bacillus methanolicus]